MCMLPLLSNVAPDAAASPVCFRFQDISGDFGFALRPVWEHPARGYPRATVLLRRRMEDAALAQARTKFHGRVVQDLLMAEQLASQVEDWQCSPTQDACRVDLERQHCGVRLRRWTVSRGCFGRLLGMLIFELRRTEIAQRGMQALCVADLVDEPWKVGGDVLKRLVGGQGDGLDLERPHEAPGLGVAVWVAAAAHGAGESMRGQQSAVGLGRILGRLKWSSQHPDAGECDDRAKRCDTTTY